MKVIIHTFRSPGPLFSDLFVTISIAVPHISGEDEALEDFLAEDREEELK